MDGGLLVDNSSEELGENGPCRGRWLGQGQREHNGISTIASKPQTHNHTHIVGTVGRGGSITFGGGGLGKVELHREKNGREAFLSTFDRNMDQQHHTDLLHVGRCA